MWHYDGISALRHARAFVLDGDRFRLADGEPLALADLEPRDAVGGDAVYGLRGKLGWRIGFAGGVPPELAPRLPGQVRYGRIIDRYGLWPSMAAFALLATITVVLFLRTPRLVARAVPPSVERKLGDLMVGDLGGRTCDGEGGGEALAAIVERIDAQDAAIDVRVVNLPIVNAVTLPGGRIVVFDGLVRAAKSPDELAGVIGHEIGHVKHRDVMESLLRQLGLSVLLGGLDGNVGGYTNALLASSYSRTAEAEADKTAIEMLRTARVSPLPTAAFFTRLGGKQGDNRLVRTINYLQSHPVSSDRAKAFTDSAKGQSGYQKTLDPTQWRALRQICLTDKSVEKPAFRF
ncbi:M48 family metallopeptidase [Sphingomonas endolithica]|uniref:M48 family metallopeptidase n=1 Tax=Sphingomonas endolithica TaxID=2972485 RepID=UPI0021B07018|nr:M48 family metallopeptidase [Sphingomonas sp. ZFBP2030]